MRVAAISPMIATSANIKNTASTPPPLPNMKPISVGSIAEAIRSHEQRDLRDVRHRSGAQCLRQRKVIDGGVKRRHPVVEAIGHEKRRGP